LSQRRQEEPESFVAKKNVVALREFSLLSQSSFHSWCNCNRKL